MIAEYPIKIHFFSYYYHEFEVKFFLLVLFNFFCNFFKDILTGLIKFFFRKLFSYKNPNIMTFKIEVM